MTSDFKKICWRLSISSKFVLFSNEAQISNEKLFTDRKHSQHIDNLTRRMKKKFESLSNATNRKELFDKLATA